MSLVPDASAVVAALVDGGPSGLWASRMLGEESLAAPHLLPVEVASVLRRAVFGGRISSDVAAIAHEDLQDLRISFFPYEPFARRIWELQRNVTTYDAWYVALAETLEAPLATLDSRLARSTGPDCAFLTPP